MTEESHVSSLVDMPSTYRTSRGAAYCCDCLDFLKSIKSESVDLILTSPPFPLIVQYEYFAPPRADYLNWLTSRIKECKRVLKQTGSLVVELAHTWQNGIPCRDTYMYRLVVDLVDDGWYHPQEIYRLTKNAQPSSFWVGVRKYRLKPAVVPLLWFSKNPFPKVNIKNVYRKAKRKQKRKESNVAVRCRSGHGINRHSLNAMELVLPTTVIESSPSRDREYYRKIKTNGYEHPCPFREDVADFIIRYMTDEKDVVCDIFMGTNTVGNIAEKLGRFWIGSEIDHKYVEASKFRFSNNLQQLPEAGE